MENLTNQRLISLDAFRGFTIAGMIIVNDPGSWSHVYGPLLHASWHGITPTDYVFPFFLFIVGVSIALAYTKQIAAGVPRNAMIQKLLKRSAIIFLLGVFLWAKGQLAYSENSTIEFVQKTFILLLVCGFLFYSDKWKIQAAIVAALLGALIFWFPEGGLEKLRIPGVLQRIAVVFLICALLFINTGWKTQLRVGVGLLVGYWALMTLVPVPIDEMIQQALSTGQIDAHRGKIDVNIRSISDNFIAANLEPGTNLEAWLDRQLIPFRLYEDAWDPEGFLSTLPSIVNGIIGMLIGHIILSKEDIYKKISWIFFFGILMYTIGGIWKWGFPFNKNLWTSSFVLHTCGLATMTLAAFILLVDVMGIKKWAFIGRVFGANSITAYVLSGMLGFVFYAGLNTFFMETMASIGMSEKMSSFIYALLFVGVVFIPVYILYRRKIYIKV